jgi:hypothetical protein
MMSALMSRLTQEKEKEKETPYVGHLKAVGPLVRLLYMIYFSRKIPDPMKLLKNLYIDQDLDKDAIDDFPVLAGRMGNLGKPKPTALNPNPDEEKVRLSTFTLKGFKPQNQEDFPLSYSIERVPGTIGWLFLSPNYLEQGMSALPPPVFSSFDKAWIWDTSFHDEKGIPLFTTYTKVQPIYVKTWLYWIALFKSGPSITPTVPSLNSFYQMWDFFHPREMFDHLSFAEWKSSYSSCNQKHMKILLPSDPVMGNTAIEFVFSQLWLFALELANRLIRRSQRFSLKVQILEDAILTAQATLLPSNPINPLQDPQRVLLSPQVQKVIQLARDLQVEFCPSDKSPSIVPLVATVPSPSGYLDVLETLYNKFLHPDEYFKSPHTIPEDLLTLVADHYDHLEQDPNFIISSDLVLNVFGFPKEFHNLFSRVVLEEKDVTRMFTEIQKDMDQLNHLLSKIELEKLSGWRVVPNEELKSVEEWKRSKVIQAIRNEHLGKTDQEYLFLHLAWPIVLAWHATFLLHLLKILNAFARIKEKQTRKSEDLEAIEEEKTEKELCQDYELLINISQQWTKDQEEMRYLFRNTNDIVLIHEHEPKSVASVSPYFFPLFSRAIQALDWSEMEQVVLHIDESFPELYCKPHPVVETMPKPFFIYSQD